MTKFLMLTDANVGVPVRISVKDIQGWLQASDTNNEGVTTLREGTLIQLHDARCEVKEEPDVIDQMVCFVEENKDDPEAHTILAVSGEDDDPEPAEED